MKIHNILILLLLAGCSDSGPASAPGHTGADYSSLSVTPRSKGETMPVTPRSKGETLKVTPRSKGETLKLTETYQQIERLGQPLINQALVQDPQQQDRWNQLPPASDRSMSEAAAYGIKAFDSDAQRISERINLLLPDVLRIDTTLPSDFATRTGPKGRAVGGRRIKDDVIDDSLARWSGNFSAGKKLSSDHVSYDGPNAHGSRHKPVLAEFPYLAAPN